MRALIAFACGVIFALGLGLSGMTNPQNVLSFLQGEDWSLMIVMASAVGLNLLAYPLIRRRDAPVLDSKFHVPESRDLTRRLGFGALLFGAGWGLAGYCPGPAVTSLAALDSRGLAFVGAMLVGMLVALKTSSRAS